MNINLQEYKDKVHACWIGKNIGGTMGAPYEGSRKFLDIKGFSSEKNVVLPNDDLDLQLVWLRAMEACGAKGLTQQALGEFWLSFITPHWNEYGTAKNNMANGLYPSLCGDAFNVWKHSNGAWIRAEIWACLAPGVPDIACKYAYNDACVDHGANSEGTVAAVFIAAIESMAFVDSDVRKLIEIGLSRIPENSRVAKSVKTVVDYYDKKADFKTTWQTIIEQNADIGHGWFQAPSNVAFVIMGLLWGEGDFKKTMICTLNCGDDTDCTGGTVGSIMGIMGGTRHIPTDWKEHIGDSIETLSISLGVLQYIPKSCSELTERIINLVPHVLFANGQNMGVTEKETDIYGSYVDDVIKNTRFVSIFNIPPYSYEVDIFHTKATVVLDGDPKIYPLVNKKIKVIFVQNWERNGWCASNCTLSFRWWLPQGFDVKGEKSTYLWSHTPLTKLESECEFEIVVPEKVEAVNRLVLEVTVSGKMTVGYIPVVFLG